MDYEIAFDDTEQCYRIVADYEFSVIADWVSEHIVKREEIQKILQHINLMNAEAEKVRLEYGVFSVNISTDGIAVNRQVDMSDATEEIHAMFDNQSGFYHASDEGVKSECGLDDMTTLLENWHKVLF